MVRDSVFDGNANNGIMAREDSELEVVGCKFTNHVSEDDKGAGIFLLGDNITTVKNCEFLKNNRGIEVTGGVRLEVDNCKFVENRNEWFGGGILFSGNSFGKVKNSIFVENSIMGIGGFDDSKFEVSKCKFLKNDQGVYLCQKSRGTLKDSILENAVEADGDSKLEVVNCNCDDIYIYYSGVHAKISNCKINELICNSSGVNINSSTISLIKYDGDSKKPVVSNSTVGRWEDTSGCYITTATCLALGKGDDCYELNMFRWFRDNWLINQPDGKKLIEEYYETAPLIVDLINKRKDYKDIYFHLWEKYLNPCLKLLERGNFIEVKRIYTEMVKRLKDDFLRQGIKMKG